MMTMGLDEMQRCIDECEQCRDTCLLTVVHCLRRGGRHADVKHITMLLDCVDMCATSTNIMLRGSELHRLACETCAVVCDACAAACEAFHHDGAMRRCAEQCRRCAEACREVATAGTAGSKE
jgi:hypothetical protein